MAAEGAVVVQGEAEEAVVVAVEGVEAEEDVDCSWPSTRDTGLSIRMIVASADVAAAAVADADAGHTALAVDVPRREARLPPAPCSDERASPAC